MKWRHWKLAAVVVLVGVMLCAAASEKKGKRKAKQLALSQAAAEAQEAERKVTEAEVPAAALRAAFSVAAGTWSAPICSSISTKSPVGVTSTSTFAPEGFFHEPS